MGTAYLKEVLSRLEAKSKFTKTKIHKDWVYAMMAQFRQHIEATKQKQEYPVLNFYCNWSLHPKLEKGIVQDFLHKISVVINVIETGHPADRVSEILSLTKLRNEIRTILKKADIEAGIFEIDENWKAFTELLFPFLLNKPLVRKLPATTPHWVETFELYDYNGHLFWRIHVMPDDKDFSGPFMRTDF